MDRFMTRVSYSSLAAAFPYILIGIIFLYASSFAFPQTDDFCMFGKFSVLASSNPISETLNMYNTWSGRYTAMFAISVTGWISSILPIPEHWTYSASLMIFLFFFGWSCFRLSSILSEKFSPNGVIASVIFASCLALMPSKLEGIFWVTGVAVYSLSLSLLPLMFYTIARDDRNKSHDAHASLSSIVLIGLTVGTNEFVGMIIGLYLVFHIAAQGIGRNIIRYAEYISVFILSFVVSVFAPGNFLRDATLTGQRHDFLNSIRVSLGGMKSVLDGFILPNAILITLLIASVFLCGWVWRTQAASSKRILPICLSLIAGFPLHLFVYAYLAGDFTPGRILNQAYGVLIIGVALLVAWLGAKMRAQHSLNTKYLMLAFVSFTGFVLLSIPSMQAVGKTIRTYGPVWKASNLERRDYLQKMAGNTEAAITLRPIPPQPIREPVLQGNDAGGDPTNWINGCIAWYYRVGSVIVVPDFDNK